MTDATGGPDRPTHTKELETLMADTVRLGIIGLGQQGGLYAGLITQGRVPHMSLGAIADTDPAKRELARTTYPDVPVHDTYQDLLVSGEAWRSPEAALT